MSRWCAGQLTLRSQGIVYGTRPAVLAYFGSIFIGLLTPGRLGEFVKALHLKQDCAISGGRALSSVFLDRLFDLFMLLAVGALALASASFGTVDGWLALVLLVLALVAPLVLLIHPVSFGWFSRLAQRIVPLDHPKVGPKLTKLGGWVVEIRAGLRQLSSSVLLVGVLLTLLAYAIFFGQCYLVALAVGLPVGFVPVSYAVALGSLITLLPVSISGIGTRDASIVAYLGALGVASAQALGFSLLIFVTFYIGGALLGALAWLLKPAPLAALRAAPATMRE
ncbi:MAG: flippase-like domain-containing protein [Chloroflexaceae bacterium]|nr:flippase-like domain-containing protein [Chloroflexaceae bacterium]